MRKVTTTNKINETIANNLLQITKAECHYKSSNRIDELSKETFTENFSFLCESGVFSDCIGWHYEQDYKTGIYVIETGRMNPDSETIVTVYLTVCNGACRENIEKELSVSEEE